MNVGLRKVLMSSTGQPDFFEFFNESDELYFIGPKVVSDPSQPFKNFTFNKKFLESLGYSLDEFRKLKLKELFPEEDIPIFNESMIAVEQGHSVKGLPHRVFKKDGSFLHVVVSLSSHGDQLFGRCRDLTEEEMNQTEFMSKDGLGELRGLGYWQVTDLDSQKMYISPKAREVLKLAMNLNYSVNEFLGVFSKEDREEFGAILDRANKGNFDTNVVFKLPDSLADETPNSVFIRVDFKSRKNGLSGGQVIYGTVEDISHQYTNELLFRALLEHLPMSVICKSYKNDPNGEFVFANKKYLEMTGKNASEVIGKSQVEVSGNALLAQNFINNDRDVLNSNEDFHEFNEILSKGGSVSHLRTWKIKIDGYTILGMSLDESSTIKMEKEVEVERARSLEAARLASLGEMAGGVAHEINNPLSILKFAIHGMRKTLERVQSGEELSTVVDKLTPYLDKSDNTIDRITKIIHGLRTFAREGKADPIEEIDLNGLIEDTMEFSKMKLKSLGIEFKLDIPDNFMVHARAVQLSQVLLNLINNAKDAIEDLESPWIQVLAVEVQGRKIIRVTDSGDGIPDSVMKKIFDPFYTTKGPQKGTGLGLSISRGLIQEMGGKFYYDDNKENTSFVISLPADPSDIEDDSQKKSSAQSA